MPKTIPCAMVFMNGFPTSEPEIIMAKVLELMLEYQKKHNIKNRCMDNVQIFHDIMSGLNMSCKVVPVICSGYAFQLDTYVINMGHLIITVGNNLFVDPSYEFQLIKDKIYFQNIRDYSEFYKQKTKNLLASNIQGPFKNKKDGVKRFLTFVSCSNNINNNLFCITDLNYYNSLLDNVLSGLSNWKNLNNIDKTITNKSVFEF
jgi:hypothetical protein